MIQKSSGKFTVAGLALALSCSTAVQAAVLFDDYSNFQNSVSGANVTTTGSTPNTFMGDAYVLATGATSITGLDLYPVNLSGTAFTGLKINVSLWGTVNTGTVNSSTPAFSNLLGTYSTTQSGAFASGFIYPVESGTAGSPGFSFSSPLSLSVTTVGVSVNYQGSTDGIHYASFNSLSSLISYGTVPTTGSEVFNGFYRNANSETDGNFTSSRKTFGLQDQSLAMRIYGDLPTVPEPGTVALLGLGGAALLIRRRK